METGDGGHAANNRAGVPFMEISPDTIIAGRLLDGLMPGGDDFFAVMVAVFAAHIRPMVPTGFIRHDSSLPSVRCRMETMEAGEGPSVISVGVRPVMVIAAAPITFRHWTMTRMLGGDDHDHKSNTDFL
jgi:hypothetical protein